MPCSSFAPRKRTLFGPLFAVLALLTVAPSAPVAAQTPNSCLQWVDTLLDTTFNCVNEPWRERAKRVQTFRWKNHDYVMLSRGNELSIHNIDDPTRPSHVDTSDFGFATRGDSDYDLLDFDVCDDCRFGVFKHKVAGTVVIDLGGGSVPNISDTNYGAFTPKEGGTGGFVFSTNGRQYLLAGSLSDGDCSGGAGLYTSDSIGDIELVECLEVDGVPFLVTGLQEFTDPATDDLYLFLGSVTGLVDVFLVDDSGANITLAQKASPAGMWGAGYQLSIDQKRAIAASADYFSRTVTIWDVATPWNPEVLWTLPEQANTVSLRSPGANGASTLFVSKPGFRSIHTYVVDASGPQEFEADAWADPAIDFNLLLPSCTPETGAALSPDGSVLYRSRNAIHQVFDLSQCLEPTPAVAAVAVLDANDLTELSTSNPVFPGDDVIIEDDSTGWVNQWAVWVTQGSSPGGAPLGVGIPSGYPATNTLSGSNDSKIGFTVPLDIGEGVEYWAHVEVNHTELPPDQATVSKNINISRQPAADFTITPETAIFGDTVILTATADGSPTAYEWTITKPSGPLDPISGPTAAFQLTEGGDWNFKLTASYEHAVGGSAYVAVEEKPFDVKSVAAVFTFLPANPLANQPITFDASLSKPVGSNDLEASWSIWGPTDRASDPVEPVSASQWVASCAALDALRCTIAADTLPWGKYDVTVTVENTAEPDPLLKTDTKNGTLTVGDDSIVPSIQVNAQSPAVGDAIGFIILGVPVDIDKATWKMDGLGCGGASSTQVCTPNQWNDCKTLSFAYSTPGTKTVQLTIEVGGNTFEAETEFYVTSGSCNVGHTCEYDLSVNAAIFQAIGGPGAFQVDTNYSDCDWSVSDNRTWITIDSPTSGSDTGDDVVNFSVDPYDGSTGATRSGTITAAGQNYSVVQNAPVAPANFVISNPRPQIGEVVTFTVDPLLEVARWDFGEEDCLGNSPVIDCTFRPGLSCNNVEWAFTLPTTPSHTTQVTMVLKDGRSKTKNPTVQNRGECCEATGKPDAAFTMSAETVYVGDTIQFNDTSSKRTQVPSKALGFGWNPEEPEIGEDILFTLGGLEGTVKTATWEMGGTDCDDEGPTVICQPGLFNTCTSVSFAYGSKGPKEVSVTVELQEGGEVSAAGTVNVAETGSCEVDPGPGDGCNYQLSPSDASFVADGGTGSFNVATNADCEWSAISTKPSWLHITSQGSPGPGAVGFSVDVNEMTYSRAGAIRVDNKNFSVTQAGRPGQTAPTEWTWTITRLEDQDGSPVGDVPAVFTDQNASHTFDKTGQYEVRLAATNCAGTDASVRYFDVIDALVENFVIGSAISQGGANNTQWESDFRFFNPCDESLNVSLIFQPENQDNTGKQLSSYPFSLSPNETMVFANAREIVDEENGQPINGSIRIDSWSGSGCKVMSVSKTFNDTTGGGLGLFVPAMPVTAVGHATLNFTGLVENSGYRSNLRLVNHGDEFAWVRIKAYDKNGQDLGEPKTVKVFGRSTKQIDGVASAVGETGNLSQFTVQTEVLTSGAIIDGLATVIDNVSGDSVMNRSSYREESVVWLPGVTHNFGVNNSQWQTDIWFHNPDSSDQWLISRATYVDGGNIDINYLFEAPDWPAVASMGMRRRLGVAESILDELGVETTSGYMVFEGLDGDKAPQIAARTFTSDDTGGTYGLHLSVFGQRDLLMVSETGYIVGVSNSADEASGFRTNLAMLATGRTAEVEITFFYPDGSQAPEPFIAKVWAGQLKQINNIFRKFGLGDETVTGTFKIEVLSGGNLVVYATEIDNLSGDSIFIPAQQIVIGVAR